MKVEYRATRFFCHGCALYGVLSIPEQPSQRGVLVVVGGPQYRAGSHRQFALLAQFLAAHGIPVMRFDYRGMGDSEGEARTFENIDEDIRHAIDEFQMQVDGLREVVIWGLCDAASAALFYAHGDRRVTGLVLLNPWVRTEQGMARAYLRHYYAQQLLNPRFWNKALRLRMDFRASIKSFFRIATTTLRPDSVESRIPSGGIPARGASGEEPLPQRMLIGLRQFRGQVLFMLSGNDLTAKEFADLSNSSREWRKLLRSPRVQVHCLPDANHTFASPEWRDEVALRTKEWIGSW